MYKILKEKISKEISGCSAKKEVGKIFSSDRIGTTPAFNRTADHICGRLKELKLKEVKKTYYNADGKTLISDWLPSPAWDCEEGYLKIIEPAELAGIVVSYPEKYLSVITNSTGTPKKGIVSELVLCEKPADLRKAKGKIVFTKLKCRPLMREIIKNKIQGIVSDYSYGIEAKNDETIYWENWWHAKRKETVFFGFKISPRAGSAIREALKQGKKVVVKAYIKAKNYSGKLPEVSGIIEGKNKKEEVIVLGHVYEIGANDNASGTGLMLEVARTLRVLITKGALKKPERSIRFLFPHEMFGTLDWVLNHRDKSRKLLAGLNMDMVGEKKKCGSKMTLELSQEEIPSFSNEFIVKLFNELTGFNVVFSEHGMSDDDVFLEDPMIGCSTPTVWHRYDKYYHSDADDMDKIDGNKLKKMGILAAVYLYFIANAKSKEAEWLLSVVLDYWKKKIEKEAKEKRDKDRMEYYLLKGSENLSSVLKLAEEKDKPDLKRKITACREKLKECVKKAIKKAKRRAEKAAYAKGMGLVPKRLKFGLLAMNGISHEEQEKFFKIAGMAFPWNNYLTSMLFWMNGERALKDINWRLKCQYKRSDPGKVVKMAIFLQKNGYVKFVNIDPQKRNDKC